jgi:hypothetical protein
VVSLSPDGGGNWVGDGMIKHTITPFEYRFYAYDTSMNLLEHPEIYDRTPFDNDYPEIFNDMSQLSAESGRPYVFRVMVTDNIDLFDETVKVNYWYGTGAPTQIPMTRLMGNIFWAQIDIPNIIGSLTYNFTATDWMGYVSYSKDTTVQILDIILPDIDTPDYDEYATTGDTYTVQVDVTDDGEIDSVAMEYYYGDNPDDVGSIIGSGSADTYTFELSIPDSLDDLHFTIVAMDRQGNTQRLPYITVPVMDDDLPVMISDMADASGTTGDQFMFKANLTDNIGIETVMVHYTLPDGTSYMGVMENVEGMYELTITLPDDMKGDLNYTYMIYDTSMNLLRTDEVTVITVSYTHLTLPTTPYV